MLRNNLIKEPNPNFIIVPLQHPDARGWAIKNKYLAKGAERAAYLLTEVDKNGLPVGEPLIAKESIHEEADQLEFHEQCGRTQKHAGRLAKKFNMRLDTR